MSSSSFSITMVLVFLFLCISYSFASSSSSSDNPKITSFDSYDVYQVLPSASTTSFSDEPSSLASEYAICKPSASVCANKRLQCPSACVTGYYDNGPGYGHGDPGGPGGYGPGYGHGGPGGPGGYGPGYGPGGPGGGFVKGSLFACSYSCLTRCTASCVEP